MAQTNKRVVVVAGGSSGLGLKIGEAFGGLHDAIVVLLARGQTQLDAAVDGLKATQEFDVLGMVVDATDESQVQQVVRDIVIQFGKIDVWVNAVGKSIRTDFKTTGIEKYRELMEANFFASVTCSLAAIPELEKTSGSLVNIGSLASKTAWPLVAPYVTGKHALAGFCHQLRLEGPANVHFLHVCPGPIKRDGNEQRYSDQAKSLPDSATKPGAGAPVKGIDPETLAKKIVIACERRVPELMIPWKSRLLFSIQQLFPKLGDKLTRRLSKGTSSDS